MNAVSNRFRLCRSMCGRSVTFRHGQVNTLGLSPHNLGRGPRNFIVGIPVRQSLTAHQAAKPQG